jgi:hypothetical protein
MMNIHMEWGGQCQRCSSESNVHIMSMFDNTLICMLCHSAERLHPDYARAERAEREELKRGNRNFKGIGYPTAELGNDPVDW